MDIYVARQPIFDKDYIVIAYELLYRKSSDNFFDSKVSDNVATSLLLMNSYFNFGIENLINDKRAFINFDKHLIKMGVPELLNPKQVTIEILESINPDAQFLKKLKRLKEQGYTLVIDKCADGSIHHEIIELIDIVKVDFSKCKEECVEKVAKAMSSKNKLLLASKVETKEEFERAKALGYIYFQGYYFAKPKIQTRKTMDSNGLQYVKLMSELNNPEPDFHVLSEIILMDISLTYKLLKLVNSDSKPVSEISSVQQALAVLGVRKFRTWLSLAMVQNMSNRETLEAAKYALIRSKLLVKIARNSNLKKFEDELSLLGTLSILDVVLEMDMKEALENLPIGEEMKTTLIGGKTKYSDAMQLCFAYEKGVFEEAEIAAGHICYELSQLPEHYVSAISWAERTFRELSE